MIIALLVLVAWLKTRTFKAVLNVLELYKCIAPEFSLVIRDIPM